MTATAIVIGGSIGTGKTTLAYQLKEYIEKTLDQNCVVLESDTERRHYLGYPLNYRMNEPDYAPEVSEHVYAILDAKEKDALNDSYYVIRTLTGQSTFDYYKTRQPADATGAHFVGIFLTASEKTIRERLRKREDERNSGQELLVEKGHASDADAGVLLKYPIPDYIPEGWHAISAEQSPIEVFEQAKRFIS